MAMGHNQWLLFGVDEHEHPFATYFDIHQGYRVLIHSHIFPCLFVPCPRDREGMSASLGQELAFKQKQKDIAQYTRALVGNASIFIAPCFLDVL